jgi:hypothetical protein
MSAAVNDTAPDFTFIKPDGSPLKLSGIPARALVLIFLRHLA